MTSRKYPIDHVRSNDGAPSARGINPHKSASRNHPRKARNIDKVVASDLANMFRMAL